MHYLDYLKSEQEWQVKSFAREISILMARDLMAKENYTLGRQIIDAHAQIFLNKQLMAELDKEDKVRVYSKKSKHEHE